jgi:hypothetical protein
MIDRISIRRPAASALGLFSACLLGACAGPRGAAPSGSAGLPAGIALPPGEEAALRLEARGTQNYECREKEGGAPGEYEWALVAPEADLFDSSGRSVGKHYAGPTWESTDDGSKVMASLKARAPAPEADAIPWLMLTVTQATGEGVFSEVKSVQRTDTHGGQPPAGACPAGELLKVPYTAVYWFSRAKG